MSSATRGSLDSEVIAAAALRITDRDGLPGLTMRAVAAECGVTAMATYWHVRNKDELIDIVVQYALSRLPAPRPDREWREEIVRFFTEMHDFLVEHPAVAQMIAQRPMGGTQVTTLADRTLATLLAGGLTEAAAVEAFLELGSYTLGMSLYEIGRAGYKQEDPTRRFPGLAPDTHPVLTQLGMRVAVAPGAGLFQNGLVRLIDSYAT
jgi:TetR/AcrR family tetracycline transcriptional repressor